MAKKKEPAKKKRKPKQPKEELKLGLEDVYLDDAATLTAARQRGIIIHKTDDYDSAGGEVEIAVREFLMAKLPRNYHIGHGHIVDSRLYFSGQHDVIIADDNHTPVLLKTKDGTEYMPYESIYAFGEVKATYYKSKKYIEEFSDALRELNTKLKRESVPTNYVGHGIVFKELKMDTPIPYRNPMFSFMICVGEKDFHFPDIAPHYQSRPVEELPSVVCVLGKGIIANAEIIEREDKYEFLGFNAHPLFNSYWQDKRGIDKWVFFPMDAARCLAVFTMILMGHLNDVLLKRPDMRDYIKVITAGLMKEMTAVNIPISPGAS